MHAYAIQDRFGLANLKPLERPEPEPGPGQIQLRMKAVALNYRDLMTVKGTYNRKQPLPLIPCSDGCGEVTAVGDGVRRVEVGDRVLPIFAQAWISGTPQRHKLRSTLGGPIDGTLTQTMVTGADGVVPAPDYLSDEEAATLACAGVTAWSTLVTQGGLRAGDVVVVQGTGGVALFAVQIARAFGARVIVTSRSDEKLERVRALGVADTINSTKTPEWSKAVQEMTGGEGADHIVELGGASTLAESLRAVRIGGFIGIIGVLGGRDVEISVSALLMRQVRLQGILVGHRETFEEMNRAFALHEIRPVIDRTFAWGEAPAAFAHLDGAGHVGKVCVRVDQ